MGDTTCWGWLITVMYAVCAVGSYYYLRILKRASDGPKLLLWRCIFVLVLLLGINKQLDFQTLLSNIGRAVSSSQGWYNQRRIVQAGFAAILIVSALAFASVILFKTRTVLRRSVLELAGVVVLIGFTLIRTSSLTYMDERLQLERIPHIHAFELLGLVLILAAIIRGYRSDKRSSA